MASVRMTRINQKGGSSRWRVEDWYRERESIERAGNQLPYHRGCVLKWNRRKGGAVGRSNVENGGE